MRPTKQTNNETNNNALHPDVERHFARLRAFRGMIDAATARGDTHAAEAHRAQQQLYEAQIAARNRLTAYEQEGGIVKAGVQESVNCSRRDCITAITVLVALFLAVLLVGLLETWAREPQQSADTYHSAEVTR